MLFLSFQPLSLVPKKTSVAAPKQRVPMSPDEVVEATRSRVANFKHVLATCGEENDVYPAVQEAISKAEYQARQLVCERIGSTKSFCRTETKEAERDAMMCVAVGQHQALEAAQRQFQPGESLYAYLDNIHM